MDQLRSTISGYLIEIDGKPFGVRDSLDEAKTVAIVEARGEASILITTMGEKVESSPGRFMHVPCSVVYWDYECDDWVYSEVAVLVKAKRKGAASG